MAGSDPKTSSESALVALGRELAGVGPAADGPRDPPAASLAGFELLLSELLGDANGEIRVYDDSGLGRLTLRADAAVVADGRAARHVTAAGIDVTGCRFVTFANGLTLYLPVGLELVVQPAR